MTTQRLEFLVIESNRSLQGEWRKLLPNTQYTLNVAEDTGYGQDYLDDDPNGEIDVVIVQGAASPEKGPSGVDVTLTFLRELAKRESSRNKFRAVVVVSDMFAEPDCPEYAAYTAAYNGCHILRKTATLNNPKLLFDAIAATEA